jgi:hypothetical protein
MGRVAQVDRDQLAALRRLRAAFGFVEVLEVRELEDTQPLTDQPSPLDVDQRDADRRLMDGPS